MGRKFLIILAGVLIAAGLSACSRQEKQVGGSNRIRIVAAIFPAWDWTRNILGENPADAELTLLLDNGVDLHSYQPSVDDILKISNCDLFIYVGGESDQWVTDALQQASNKNKRIISMMDILGNSIKEEEFSEGMQVEQEENRSGINEPEYDEHVWLSLRNAAGICDVIAEQLSLLDPENSAYYNENAAAYKEKLDALDHAYQEAVSESALRTLLFGDRFPFRYLTEDYGLDYYAAFSGCSAETEASFETITFLARKADELGSPVVLTIDGNDQRIAQTIVRNTALKNQKILILNSMQSISSKDIQNNVTYLSVMENNLDVIKQALEDR